MGVKIDIDTRKIEARVTGAVDAARALLTNEVRKDCDYYVKKDVGTLRDSAATASDYDAGTVVYNTVYARRQYYTMRGIRVGAGRNPHASRRWFWMAKRRFLEQWNKQAQAFLREELGKRV